MSELRAYQMEAVQAVRRRSLEGASIRSVLLVSPTGSGKTVMGLACLDDAPTLWVVHRREILLQTYARMAGRFGDRSVGVLMGGVCPNRAARIQIATVQTLLRVAEASGRLQDLDVGRSVASEIGCVVLDEAHHYVAEEWRAIASAYPTAKILGLTATPEREDGSPLGDIFQGLVVAAAYSRLLREQWIVPARVYRPATELAGDLAQHPYDAWRQYSEGSPTMVFSARVSIAEAHAKIFRDRGIPAAVIHAETRPRDRDDIMAAFRSGRISVIVNVATMTEGVDVDVCRTVILAANISHVSGLIQRVGRALRPAIGKKDAIVLDLVGCTHRLGMPTDDREYSLTGRPISGVTGPTGPREPAEYTFEQAVVGVELGLAGGGESSPPPKAAPIGAIRRRARMSAESVVSRMFREEA